MKYKELPPQELLLKLFKYDPDTGVVTRRISSGPRARAGDIVNNKQNTGYLAVSIMHSSYLLHRIIWKMITGRDPISLDHINHKKEDNSWSNLREATKSENGRNVPIRIDNSSGFTGVVWNKSENKWQTYITLEGKTKHLGIFSSKLDAVAARIRANREYGYHENHGRA